MDAVVSGRAMMPHMNKAEWLLLGISAFFGAAGIFFLALSLNRYLERIYTPDKAALASAGVVFAGSFLAVLLRTILKSRKESKLEESRKEIRDNIHVLVRDVYSELEDPIRENPKTAVAVAAIAGFLAVNHRQH